jgi:hypothetical protein
VCVPPCMRAFFVFFSLFFFSLHSPPFFIFEGGESPTPSSYHSHVRTYVHTYLRKYLSAHSFFFFLCIYVFT